MKKKLATILVAIVCLLLAVRMYSYQRAVNLKSDAFSNERGRKMAEEDAKRYRDP